MTFSWMLQFIQANQGSSTFSWIDIVIPESEIPSWINNQSEGDSIRIDPYPTVHDNDIDNNFIGIAYCAVFSVAPEDPIMATNARLSEFTCVGFGRCRSIGSAIIPLIVDGDLITTQSSHMCLIYYPQKTFDFVRPGKITEQPDDLDVKARIKEGKGFGCEGKEVWISFGI
jgi:hypothetical protein